MDYPSAPIVSASWLADHLSEVASADVRWSLDEGPKRAAYELGHIPGAVFVDLDRDLSDPPGHRGRHPLPAVDRFLGRMADLGLLARPVICYDDQSGAVAARLWWMLSTLGYPAAVLDGGIQAWTGALAPTDALASESRSNRARIVKGTEDTGELAGAEKAKEVRSWPSQAVVDIERVMEEIQSGAVLLDARSRGRFEGTERSVDRRPGHVPGATSRPWTDNVGVDGRLKPSEQLRAELAELGVGQGRWMASCGSGVTGCHNLLAGAVAGLDRGRLFAGSWSQWAYDDDRPVETGPGAGDSGCD
jgi:thiosulfate/3-mercaptopyruvate sulfurtransferase